MLYHTKICGEKIWFYDYDRKCKWIMKPHDSLRATLLLYLLFVSSLAEFIPKGNCSKNFGKFRGKQP